MIYYSTVRLLTLIQITNIAIDVAKAKYILNKMTNLRKTQIVVNITCYLGHRLLFIDQDISSVN